jgi:hypothetical protein
MTLSQTNNKVFLIPTYIGIRAFTLFIYLVFIIVFIGFFHPQADSKMQSAEVILFGNDFMKISFVIIIAYYLIDFIMYMVSGLYKETTAKELAVPFDSRSIVMHVVIVTGAVSTAFLGEWLFGSEERAVPIIFASFFVLMKTAVDLWAARQNVDRETMVLGKVWVGKEKEDNED